MYHSREHQTAPSETLFQMLAAKVRLLESTFAKVRLVKCLQDGTQSTLNVLRNEGPVRAPSNALWASDGRDLQFRISETNPSLPACELGVESGFRSCEN